MFKYCCQLFLRYDTEIVPIGLFTDDAHWRTPVPDHFELSLPGKTFIRFEYYLIKLKHLDYRQFLATDNPLALGLMAKMDYNRAERVRLKADFLRWILARPLDPARRSLLVEFVETYVPLGQREQAEFQQLVRSERNYVEVERMITVYEKQALRKGRQEGKQEDVILLLEKKFGKLTPEVRRKVGQIESNQELESLLLAVLDARSLEDLPL
jgi:hypothetical protein